MFKEFLNKIICGDALEVLKQIPDGCVDCVITSPPYNKNGFRGFKCNHKSTSRWYRWEASNNIVYGEYKDDRNEEEYKLWQVKVLNEFYRILKSTGGVFYNHKVRRNNCKASHPFEWIVKSKLKFYQEIIWNRMSTVDHNVNYLNPITEKFFWLIKEKATCYKDKIPIQYHNEIWNIPPDSNSHPAPFPLAIIELIIQISTKRGDIILDPFIGSGTTALAALKHNRNFIGIELNKDYVKRAEEIKDYEKQQGKLFV